MQEKLQWEAPQIYSLDSNQIKSGQANLGGTEGQTGYFYLTMNTRGPFTAGGGAMILVPNTTPSMGVVYYTRNGTQCRTQMLTINGGGGSYGRVLDQGTGGTANFVSGSFAVACPFTAS